MKLRIKPQEEDFKEVIMVDEGDYIRISIDGLSIVHLYKDMSSIKIFPEHFKSMGFTNE